MTNNENCLYQEKDSKIFEKLSEYREMIVEIKKQAKERSRARRLKEMLFAIASAYNEIHCWAGYVRTPIKPTWMCPECNTIHNHSEDEHDMNLWFLCGPIYPECCSFNKGHRMFEMHAAKTADKELWDIVHNSHLNKKWSCLLSEVDPFKPFDLDKSKV